MIKAGYILLMIDTLATIYFTFIGKMTYGEAMIIYVLCTIACIGERMYDQIN